MSDVVLRRFCAHCGTYPEPHQIRMAGPAHAAIAVCAACGGQLTAERQRVTTPLLSVLIGSFKYPLQPAVALSIVIVAVVSAFVRFVPLIGGLLSATIVIAFLFLVLRSSAEGRDDLSSDAEIASSLVLWLEPLVRYVLTFVVSFSGAGLAWFMLGWPDGAPVVLGLALAGLVYLPAGMVVAAHREGCLGPLNPVPGARMIARIPGPYFLTLGFLALTLSAGGAIGYVASLLLGEVVIVGPMLVRVLGLIAPVVMARQLGVLVHEHSEEL